MQTLITKIRVKNVLNLSKGLLRTSLPETVCKYQMAIYSKYLTHTMMPIYQFSSKAGQNVGKPEDQPLSDLKLRIAASGTIADLLSLAEEDIEQYDRDHVVFFLKNISKMFSRQFLSKEYSVLANSEVYSKISQKLADQIPYLSSSDVLDVIFWLRKSKVEKLPCHLHESEIQKIVERAESFVNEHKYPLNTLINLLYDLSLLRKQAFVVVNEILRELKSDSKSLTIQKALELLEVCSVNKSITSFNFFTVVDILQRQLEGATKTLEIEEKCKIFKNLASLDLQINPPRFRYSPLQFSLKDDLMKSFGEMSETAVLNLLEAYSYLGSDFPGEMLKNLKEIILSILSNSGDSLRTFFLVTLIEKKNTFRKSFELNEMELKMMYDVLMTRVPHENFFASFKNLERIMDIYFKTDVKHPQFVEAVYKKVVDLQLAFISIPMMIVFSKFEFDIHKIIEPYVNAKKSKDSSSDWRLFIAYSMFSDSHSVQRFNELKSEVLNDTQGLLRALRTIDTYTLTNKKINQFLEESCEYIIAKKNDMTKKEFYEAMFASCQIKSVRMKWIDYAEKNFTELEKADIVAYTVAFFSETERYQIEQTILFCHGFFLFKPMNVDLRKLIECLLENKPFYQSIKHLDEIPTKFFESFLKIIESSPKDFRVSFGFGIIKRLEFFGLPEKLIFKFSKGIYPFSKSQTMGLDSILFYQYLLENDILNGEDAKALYKTTKSTQDRISQVITISGVASYILQKSPLELGNIVFMQEVNQIIKNLNAKLVSENESKKALNLVISILRFPPSLISLYKDDYIKNLKANLNQCGPIYYKELVKHLPETYILQDKEFYEPIVELIVKNYHEYKPKFNLRDTIFLSKRFAELRVNNPAVTKTIVASITKAIPNMSPDEIIVLFDNYSSDFIIYPEIIDAILEKIILDLPQYTKYLKSLTFNLFRMGYQSTRVTKLLDTLNRTSINQAIQAFPSIVLTIIQNYPDEVSRLDALFDKVVEIDANEIYFKRIYKFFAIVYKEKTKWRDILEKKSKKNMALNDRSQQDFVAPKHLIEELCVFLRKMNVEYIKTKLIDDFPVDIHIPDGGWNIKLFTAQDLYVPGDGARGLANLSERIYKALDNDHAIFINTQEFFSLKHPEKIEYLKSKGIKTDVTNFDFSDVTNFDPEKDKKFSPGQLFKGRDGSRAHSPRQIDPK